MWLALLWDKMDLALGYFLGLPKLYLSLFCVTFPLSSYLLYRYMTYVNPQAQKLLKDSAQKITQALQNPNPLLAFEDAVVGHTMARMAQEFEPNTSRLSTSTGVQYGEYLAYTSTIVNETRARLK